MDIVYNHGILKERRHLLRIHATEAERLLWKYIRNRQIAGCKFTRQYSVGAYILDFCCIEKRLAIELDGIQHADKDALEYDAARSAFLSGHDIHVLRFWNKEVLNDISQVIHRIQDHLQCDRPSYLPLGARGIKGDNQS